MAQGRLCNRDGLILTAMVLTEFSNVGVNTLVKSVTSKGVSPCVVRLLLRFWISSSSSSCLLLLQIKISSSADFFNSLQNGTSWSNCTKFQRMN
ncbi:hypothetical protein IGI04_034839 [Brassica rapa subsp. trilocularis]|uniref:Secreted protein n=1 Tax=Brassica rapa subsp. trilocularis TaxID=1813537 RepID=A0ABQ7LCS3_BRACM|nr:hypothetical protein IGI04_034839 [Brassica rapa subsp. trilocularis]